jgi:hypothetical protein
MPDSEGPEAEPEVQLLFSVLRFAAAVLLAALVINFAELYRYIPNRAEHGPRDVRIRFDPVRLDAGGFGGLKLAGAWSLKAPDPRFGGLSAVAVDQNDLLALSDSGVLVRFPKPGATHPMARIDELPDGPGDPGFKRNRDSESLARDREGRGWWVGFENRNALWLFDSRFERVLARGQIGRGWPRTGFEAIVQSSGGMLLFPESGGRVLVASPGHSEWLTLPAGPVSDAAALPDGSLLVLERGLRLDGFHNRLVQVRRNGDGYVAVRSIPLGVGRFDNIEGVAVERGTAGALRLWLITDDGHQWPQRTLLVALDWPSAMDGGNGVKRPRRSSSGP